MIIGGKGRQIKGIMDESGTDIIVNMPVKDLRTRSVTIRGAPKNIAIGCAKIYTALEKFTHSADTIEKVAVRSIN